MPTHVVMPETRIEIQAILKIANEQNVPVYIRGGSTSHWDAYLSQEPGIMLDFARMNKILDINERDLVATVQPNCTWAKLDQELRKRGLTYICSEAGGPVIKTGCIRASQF